MYTLLIIGFVIYFGCLIYHACVYEPCVRNAGLIAVVFCMILAVFSTGNAEEIPKDYVQIESYSYVTETGAIETLAGPFYTKDGDYYEKDLIRAHWVPFATCDFEKVDLPQSATTNNPITTNRCPNCQSSCTTPYCGQCGTKIPQE